MLRVLPEKRYLPGHGLLPQKGLVRHLVQNGVAVRQRLRAQMHCAAQTVLRTVIPNHVETEFLCQRGGLIILRHHRHAAERLLRHSLQRPPQQCFAVYHRLQLVPPEAVAAACRHDDTPDAQLLHTATVLSLVVYQLQYAPSIGKWPLFAK